jgi:hypothetical protein
MLSLLIELREFTKKTDYDIIIWSASSWDVSSRQGWHSLPAYPHPLGFIGWGPILKTPQPKKWI